MRRLQKKVQGVLHYLSHDIWHVRLDSMPRTKSWLVKQLRIFVLAFRGFKEDEGRLRASAMTYYSLMSIIPVAALAFAIAKGFGLEKVLERLILENFSENQAMVNKLLTFTNTLIHEASGGIIAGIGLLVLIWAIVEILSHIEHSFNHIWHVKESRGLLRKIPEYLTLAVVAPVLMIVSSSAAAFLSSQFDSITREYSFFGNVGPLVSFLMNLSPYFITWLLFTILYMVIPNTSVKFRPAVVSGLIAGTVFQLTQTGYFVVQIELIDINAIYGSFAAIPLLILWLRMSWIIIIFGAEMSYAMQNVQKYEYELDVTNISGRSKKVATLLVMHAVIRRFSHAEAPPTAMDISKKLRLPLKLVRQILYHLLQCNLINEARTGKDKEFAYVPAFDINRMTVQLVLERTEALGNNEIDTLDLPVFKRFHEVITQFGEAEKSCKANQLLMDVEE